MKHRRYQRWWVAITVGLCLSLIGVPSVMAGQQGASQSELEELRQQLESLQDDIGEDGEDELSQAMTWLDEAERLDARGSRTGVEQRTRRIDHTIDLLRVLTETQQLRATIESQHEAYETSQNQLDRMRNEIEDLEQQKEARQRELEQIRGEE